MNILFFFYTKKNRRNNRLKIEEISKNNRRNNRKTIDDILDCRFGLDCHPNNRVTKFGLSIVQKWLDWIGLSIGLDWIGLDWQPCREHIYYYRDANIKRI